MSDLAKWYEAAVERAKREGRWPGPVEFERLTGVSRQQLHRLSKGQRLGPDALRAIAEALGEPVPELKAIVRQTGASAAVVASLAAVRSELQSAVARIEAVERELTGGPSGAELARAAAVKAKRKGDRAQQQRGGDGGSQSA